MNKKPIDSKHGRKRQQNDLENLLMEGLESGQPIEITEEYIQKKRAELLARIEERKRAS